jgi:HK97 family phage major capsid protein
MPEAHIDPNVDQDEFVNYTRGLAVSLSTGQDDKGGFLVPPHVVTRFQNLLDDLSPIRKIARVDTISTDSLEILKDQGEADCGWVQETDARPATKSPGFTKQKIEVHEIYAKPILTQKLLDDAMINLEPWILEKIAEKMARAENHAFLFGDGHGKPKGLLHERDQIQTIESGVHLVDTLIKTSLSLAPFFLRSACFVMSPQILSRVQTLKDPGTGHFIFQQSLQNSAPSTLLGYPIVVSEALDQEQAIIFGSFYEGYQIVDRQGLSLLRDPFSVKPFVEFYARKRVGGDVTNYNAFRMITFEA